MNDQATDKDRRIKEMMQEHSGGDGYGWISDFVYGGIDGAVTTFAVVAGVEGASLSVPIILILGFANLFADGFSMSVGKYMSDKAELEQYEKIKQIEYRHIKEYEEIERDEVREILRTYNFKGEDLERATAIVTSDPDAWVDLMMRNEFNMTHENVEPIKGALVTFAAFLSIGFIPLVGYTFGPLFHLDPSRTFIFTCFSTLIGLFVVGAVKSRFSLQHWLTSGLQIMLMGGMAAALAYGVGFALRGLA